MEVPMLDEDEYAIALKLYGQGVTNRNVQGLEARVKPLLDYYKQVTGWTETNANAIMHHRVAQYGPPCENCGKPYRTHEATFCAACGHKRL